MKLNRILALVLAMVLALSCVAVIFAAEETAAAAEAALETQAEAPEADAAAGIDISMERLPANLGRMGVGMLCIIIVMGVLIGATIVLNKVTAPKQK